MKETKQEPVFLQAYIKPDQVENLRTILNGGQGTSDQRGHNPSLPGTFFNLEDFESVHFARWLIAPATDKFKASVIYSANVDGSAEDHLKEIALKLGDELDQIFELCENYSAKGSSTEASRLAYLNSVSFSSPAFYVGAPNRSVTQIKNEEKLHVALRKFVKENGKKWSSRKESYREIQKFLAADPQWDWAREEYQLPKKKGLKMILFLGLLLLLLPILILAILYNFLFHELWDKTKGKTINDIPVERMQELKLQEDIIYQNQLSQVFETKGGVRRLLLRFLLWATNFAARNWFIDGELMGTPTIHFARWVFIDGGKRFVFFSNFDGSFDGYLGDFVDNNGWGLNAIYGAAKGYPKTYFLFLGGSYKIAQFMGWGRGTQVISNVWYSAYPWMGLQQICSKSELRAELFNSGELNDKQINELLRKI